MEFAEGLTGLMDAAARGEAGPELLSRCCGPGLRARRVKRGERILHAGFPIRSVRIMLSGRCHVLTISRDGRSFIAYVNEGFQIYGLTELLCGGEAFSASITAEEDCLFAEADARRFCALLENSGGFSGVVLRYLASLVERAMQTSVRRRFAGGYEAVLLYLHERVRQETPPVSVRINRRVLSELLGLNLRTLYRYFDRLEAEGYAVREHGRLALDGRALGKLEAAAREIYERM